MSNYRRSLVLGGTYFFTVNLQNRSLTLLVDHIDALRSAVKIVQKKKPFQINAWVVLPDHLHTIWTMPEGDNDYSSRWRDIKKAFSKSIPAGETRTKTNLNRHERGIWQRRFWEHTIRDEIDFKHHFDYVHVNPLKHGYVQSVQDWPYSTFHREVKKGVYEFNWCGEPELMAADFE